VEVVYLVGGGARNRLLCQATADASGLPVVSGPIEATAIGNLLVQARGRGLLGADLGSLRACVRQSFACERYEPRDITCWDRADKALELPSERSMSPQGRGENSTGSLKMKTIQQTERK
jgi:rhamnulokinase